MEEWLKNQTFSNQALIVREPLSKMKNKKFVKWQNEADKNKETTHPHVAVQIEGAKMVALAVDDSFSVDRTICQLADDGYKFNSFLGIYWHYLLVADTTYEKGNRNFGRHIFHFYYSISSEKFLMLKASAIIAMQLFPTFGT